MLRVMHKYQRQFGGLVLIGAIVLAMSGFGLSFLEGSHEAMPAITVNESKINHQKFFQERKKIDARYRQMFGKSYPQIAASLQKELGEQTKDQIIRSALLDQTAQHLGLYTGRQNVSNVIRTKLMPQGFDRATFEAYLAEQEITAQEFRDDLAREILRDDLINTISDAGALSLLETKQTVEQNETTFDASYLELLPSSYVAAVGAPDEATLNAFYEEHKSEYREPLRASYEYAIVDPANFATAVEVSEDELAVYFSDHQSEYMLPEQAKVNDIQLSFPAKANADQIAAVKKTADEVKAKLDAGEAFDALALKYSDDVATKTIGGALGWVDNKSKYPKEIVEAAFALKGSGVSAPIETASGYHLIKVDEYKAATPKEFSSVKEAIKNILQRQEAPSYAASKAGDVLEKWQNDNAKTLTQAVADLKLTVATSEGFLAAGKDPTPEVAGLTSKILELPDGETKSLISINKKPILVFLKERKEPEIPELATIKDKLLDQYKIKQSIELARKAGNEILTSLKDKKFDSLSKAAEASKLAVKQEKGLGKGKPNTGIFGDQKVQAAVFSSAVEGYRPNQVFEVGQKLYLLEVNAIHKPSAEDLAAKLATQEKQESQQSGQLLVASLVNEAEARARIDFDPNILGQR